MQLVGDSLCWMIKSVLYNSCKKNLQKFSIYRTPTHFIRNFQDKDEQTRLEMKHRKEEDDLYRKFAKQREEQDKRIKEEIRVIIFGWKKKTVQKYHKLRHRFEKYSPRSACASHVENIAKRREQW